jgi:hypothetical protein
MTVIVILVTSRPIKHIYFLKYLYLFSLEVVVM